MVGPTDNTADRIRTAHGPLRFVLFRLRLLRFPFWFWSRVALFARRVGAFCALDAR